MEEGKEIKIFRFSEAANAIVANNSESIMYMVTSTGNVIIWNLNSIKPQQEKVEFDRLTYDEDGNKVVHIEGPRELLIRDLQFHEEEYINMKSLPSPIEGVTYYKGKLVLLLKNGIHWDGEKNKEFMFGSEQEVEG